jgi:hypothetical protein
VFAAVAAAHRFGRVQDARAERRPVVDGAGRRDDREQRQGGERRRDSELSQKDRDL